MVMVAREQLQELEREVTARWKALVGLVAKMADVALPLEREEEAQVLIVGQDSEGPTLAELLQAGHIPAAAVSSLGEAMQRGRNEYPQLLVIDESLIEDSFDWKQLLGNGSTRLAIIGNSSTAEGWQRWIDRDIDAYLSKSMSVVEQAAHLQALLRRSSPGEGRLR